MISKRYNMNSFITNERQQKIIFLGLGILCLTPWISSPIALLIGFILAISSGNAFEKYLHRYIQVLLQASIIGLGFGLKLNEALQVGKTGLLLTMISIVIVMTLGYFLGKIFRLEKQLTYLT